MSQSLADIIAMIQNYSSDCVFNPWSQSDPLDLYPHIAAGKRSERLVAHFKTEAKYLLIGEAPGYQGCRYSGVAFTNEKLLMSGSVPRVTIDGRLGRITNRPLPWSEPSATIVWRTIHRLGIAEQTVMWNAFAWHPHKPSTPHSNRAPNRSELFAGKHVLQAVVQHFEDARVIAVGRTAENALHTIGFEQECVRHPAYGGATEFSEGLEAIVRSKQQ